MKTWNWRSWVLPYIVPAVVLYGSLMIMVAIGGDPDIAWSLFVAPPTAFLAGFLFPPRHSWIAPAIASLMIATTVVVATLLGHYDPQPPLVTVYPILLLLVGVPETIFVFFGKVVRAAVEPWWEERQRGHRGPRVPAG